MKIIAILILLWTAKASGLVCTASPTNKDPSVIATCYGKMLSHFEEVLKRQIAFNYANHLKTPNKLNDSSFRRKYYTKLFNELEQIQRMKHRLNYPDPRPAVRCETGGGNSE